MVAWCWRSGWLWVLAERVVAGRGLRSLRHGDGTLLLRLHALHLRELLPPLVLELGALRLELRLLDPQLVALLLHHELPDVREVGAAQWLEEVRVGAA